ncbi:serine hydrolase domain-containing protein [Porphyrobacter sp. LM 6]|uniref:serine hydrolase domain-containing protein n=1 Tax=Porphyrobacter sp. LM 6 TaxID=1896196 RepID=UPI0008473AEB|nr:serine hydrolase [Porphyrobacter sp. LM 6]AOL95191.1 CubicO group peptidase, beta-lactamase class C family [Porphyrobacter sp. LM 6]
MIRVSLAAATLLLASAPATAQSEQDALDARYNRALAAGYKALMLCGAIANAEANGTTRTPDSVAAWELTGIQAPMDGVVGELPFDIIRRPSGQIAHVAVKWAEDMPARIAAYYGPDTGCSILPIGAREDASNPGQSVPRKPALAAPANDGRPIKVMIRHQLEAVIGNALDGTAYGKGARTTAVIVLDEGTSAAEEYAPGFDASTPQRTFSVAKSIAATLVGAAVMAGEISVDDPINLNSWVGGGANEPRNAITIDHALRMATGRYSDTPGNRTDPLYYGGSSVNETATPWPVVYKPGTVFRYANNDTLLAIKAIGPWLDFYPPRELFAKIGMKHTVAETDWKGDYVLSSQVWSTARDLAAFGELYLNDGVTASGERILPEGWVKYVTTPSGPQPTTGTFGYGAGFWLMNKEEGVPPDTFTANGNRGQYVVIVPSRKVVIVRRGEDPVGARFDIAAFTRDVLAALPAD